MPIKPPNKPRPTPLQPHGFQAFYWRPEEIQTIERTILAITRYLARLESLNILQYAITSFRMRIAELNNLMANVSVTENAEVGEYKRNRRRALRFAARVREDFLLMVYENFELTEGWAFDRGGNSDNDGPDMGMVTMTDREASLDELEFVMNGRTPYFETDPASRDEYVAYVEGTDEQEQARLRDEIAMEDTALREEIRMNRLRREEMVTRREEMDAIRRHGYVAPIDDAGQYPMGHEQPMDEAGDEAMGREEESKEGKGKGKRKRGG